MIWLWVLILAAPLLVALFFAADEPTRVVGRWLAPWASVPALVLGLVWPVNEFVEAEWFLLGTRFGIDDTGRLFMILAAALWTIAGFYASHYTADDPKRDRFWVYFLLTMTGNLGLIGAFDLASFYLFFALMTFAAFGLVVHDGTALAHFAARIYIIMAVLGEAMLLLGLMLTARAAPDLDLRTVAPAIAADPRINVITGLLLAGFGVKAGAVLLHMWLPLAHPAAPAPASAVLSGVMIKAGLIGWLRFLPGGEVEMIMWGGLLLAFGIVSAFYGVALGLLHRNPKTTLAYSSISQMGYMSIAVGIGLMRPDLWSLAVMAAAVYAMHHGMAKGALFLGVGVAHRAVTTPVQRWALMAALAIAALSLAGVPLSTGFLAKADVKDLAARMPGYWARGVEILLSLAAVGTTLLLGRFLWLIHHRTARAPHHHHPAPGLWKPWLVAMALVLTLPWLTLWWYDISTATLRLWTVAKIWTGIWPVILGIAIIAVALRAGATVPRGWKVFPGDILVIFYRLARAAIEAWSRIVLPATAQLETSVISMRNRALLRTGRSMAATELAILRWGSGGATFVALTLILLIILFLRAA